jgi:hypothetical protein
MRHRILCALGSVASVASIWAIAQHKYASGLPNFVASLCVALIAVAGLFALAWAILGDSPAAKK